MSSEPKYIVLNILIGAIVLGIVSILVLTETYMILLFFVAAYVIGGAIREILKPYDT